MSEQLKILYHAKSILEDKNSYVLGLCGVMRNSIHYVTGSYLTNSKDVMDYIPELITYKPEKLHPTIVFWFPVGEKLPRLEIINQLIKIYEKIYSTI